MTAAGDMMQEAHVSASTTVSLHQTRVPQISEPDDVLIKVKVAGCNIKDWKMPAGHLTTISACPNSGDDLAGTIAALGSAAPAHLHVNQRVAALHELGAPHGAYAEYALVKAFACIPLPDTVSFEEGVTLPMAVAVASIGLFARECLGVRQEPWRTTHKAQVEKREAPLLIYGAATQVGAMAVKLARLPGVRPLLCVAGRGKTFVEGLLDKDAGDVFVDYREGDDAVVQALGGALDGRTCTYAFDAVSTGSSYANLARVLAPAGRLTMVLPGKLDEGGLEEIEVSYAMAGSLWKRLQPRAEGRAPSKHVANLGILEDGSIFAQGMSLYVAELLAQGRLQGHPYEVLPGGLGGLEDALNRLKAGQNSAVKYVVRVGETANLGES